MFPTVLRFGLFSTAEKNQNWFFLQNKMASDVAAQFKVGKATEQKQIVSRGFTENPEAFEFYLKGEFERQKTTTEGNRKSIEYYRRAWNWTQITLWLIRDWLFPAASRLPIARSNRRSVSAGERSSP
jgi:hypothetical protein